MAVPRGRHSNARKNAKRSHHSEIPKQAATCKNCKNPVIPHRMCTSCGHYKGRSYKVSEI